MAEASEKIRTKVIHDVAKEMNESPAKVAFARDVLFL